MSIVSFTFVIFVVILLVLYYTIFKNNQWLLLLCGSLVFYCYASPKYLLFLIISISTVYFAGNWIGEIDKNFADIKKSISDKDEVKRRRAEIEKTKKLILVTTLIINVLILIVLKYTGFFMNNIGTLFNIVGLTYNVPSFDFILPLGISFYTFMSISYLLDVYWGVCEPQNNFFKYALYISYFPHITSGPIDSYSDLREQLYAKHAYDSNVFKEGLYRIIVGFFKKLVIASRLAVYVDRVYSDVSGYGSFTLLCATFFYAFQMYCDFSGYIDIAVGVSKLFGINIVENFDLPYFSKSIPEYWRRWHITLGAWFRTYIFYPVTRSKMCKEIAKRVKKKFSKSFASMVTTIIALAVVWFLTGLWHGASWHYVAHGLFHGGIIILSTLLATSYKKWKSALHISDNSRLFHVFQIARTFILVDFSYILFRADSLRDAVYIIKQIFAHMTIDIASIETAILPFTEDNTAVAYGGVSIIALLMLIVVEIVKYNKIKVFKNFKYVATSIMILMILLFGVFGQSSFLYEAY